MAATKSTTVTVRILRELKAPYGVKLYMRSPQRNVVKYIEVIPDNPIDARIAKHVGAFCSEVYNDLTR